MYTCKPPILEAGLALPYGKLVMISISLFYPERDAPKPMSTKKKNEEKRNECTLIKSTYRGI